MDAIKIIKKHGEPGGLPVMTAYISADAPGEVPASAIGDSGKVLTVGEDGAPTWAEGGGGNFVTITDDGENITCDHTYDELYENVPDYNFRVTYPPDVTTIGYAARFNDRNLVIEVYVLGDMLAEITVYAIHSDNSITARYGTTNIEVILE